MELNQDLLLRAPAGADDAVRRDFQRVLGLSAAALGAAAAGCFSLSGDSPSLIEGLSWATINQATATPMHMGVRAWLAAGAQPVMYTDTACDVAAVCGNCEASAPATAVLAIMGAVATAASLIPTYRRAYLADCENSKSTGTTTALVSSIALLLAGLNFHNNCRRHALDTWGEDAVDTGAGWWCVVLAALVQACAALIHAKTPVVSSFMPSFMCRTAAPECCQGRGCTVQMDAPVQKFAPSSAPVRPVASTRATPVSAYAPAATYQPFATPSRALVPARRQALRAEKQDFLEATPYYDMSSIPVNTYKNKSPYTGTVVSVKRIVGPNATGETCDVVIDHGGKMPYWEGQSYGVIPPGTNPKNGKPNTVRLYSIASSRYGDDMTGNTTTLCVRRATYWDPELGADDPAKKGVCSNFLCDAKPGDKVSLTGPSGKVMLMPEDKPETDLIMVATGTGIAPYRSMCRRIFEEKTPFAADYKGLAWLFLGVANSDALLYDDDWKRYEKEYPDTFRYSVALSREQTNKSGGKMYIQDRMEEYAEEIFDRLDKGAHIYFCGLKGMMPGIQEMLKKVAESKGLDYDDFIKGLKSNHQWHVEVY